jgi:5-methylcytosine-specific restriction enzyme A
MPTLPEKRHRPWLPTPGERKEHTKYTRDNRYHTQAWRNTSKRFLAANPLCVSCMEEGRTEPAKVTDHKVRVKDGASFWDESNYQALCERHHNIKRGKERHGK